MQGKTPKLNELYHCKFQGTPYQGKVLEVYTIDGQQFVDLRLPVWGKCRFTIEELRQWNSDLK